MATPAEILISIRAIDQAAGAFKSVTTGLGGMETAAAKASRALVALGAAAAVGAVGGLALGLGAAVKEAAEFEKVMSGVKAVSGATAPEMATLSGLALQLGADTKFSATEAGRGIEELIKAGVSIGDVMGGAAAASLSLAAAGEIEVGESASIAANAMNAFNLKGADLAHVADVIAGAANASAIDVNDFKFSLAASGAVAATVGFSFDDLATAIAVMGQAGIKGSDAGTSLKTMMLNLQPATKKQKELFQELGIVTADGANQFFDAAGKVRSMAEVAQVLQTALAGMTEQQKLAALEVMFGSDAIRASAVLAKAGAAGFNEMAGAMSKVTAESVAAERLNNLQGSLEKLKGSLQTAAVVVGTAFLPALRQIVDAITVIVNDNMPQLESGATAMAAAFVAALPSVIAFFQALVDNRETIALVAAALAGFVVVNTVVSVITGLIAAITALGGVMGAIGAVIGTVVAILGGPITLAIVALIAIVATLAAAWSQNWGDIQGITQSAVDAIGTAITAAGEFFTNLVAAVQAAWEGIQIATAAAGTGLSEAMAATWAAVQAATDAALAALGATIIAAWETIFNAQTRAAFAAFVADAQLTWDSVVALITAALTALQALIAAAWTAIQAAITAANAAITADIAAAWAAIEAAITAAMAAIESSVAAGWSAVQAATTSANDVIKAAVETAWNSMAPTVGSALNSVKSTATSAWNSIKGAIDGILASIVSAAGAAGSGMVNAFAQNVLSRMSSALSAVRKMADEIKSLLPHSDADKGPLSTLTAQGAALPATLAKGILAGTPALLRSVGTMASGMSSLIGAPGAMVLQPAIGGAGAIGTSRGGLVAPITIQVNAPIYGVNDMEDVVVRALERADRRGRT